MMTMGPFFPFFFHFPTDFPDFYPTCHPFFTPFTSPRYYLIHFNDFPSGLILLFNTLVTDGDPSWLEVNSNKIHSLNHFLLLQIFLLLLTISKLLFSIIFLMLNNLIYLHFVFLMKFRPWQLPQMTAGMRTFSSAPFITFLVLLSFNWYKNPLFVPPKSSKILIFQDIFVTFSPADF